MNESFPNAWAISAMPSRNSIEGFAGRTQKNLDFIIAAYKEGEDVHVVTQVIVSLLGIVVFPFEHAKAYFPSHLTSIVDLDEENGWPTWEYLDNSKPSADLFALMRSLRNATAHGGVVFSSDSRNLEEVSITFTNKIPKRLGGGHWKARIRGDELLRFCRRSLDLIEEMTQHLTD